MSEKTMTAAAVVRDLKAQGDPVKAAFFPRFFKAGPGEYGEGDKFFGVIVPKQRKLAKAYRDLSLAHVEKLLDHAVHEVRLTGLLIMVEKVQRARKKGDQETADAVVDLYLRRLDRVNNWDLVDSSAYKILGPELERREDTSLLDDLATRDHLWSQRVAMITTYYFIKQGSFDDALRIADALLHHPHDLIHKAVGWMVREVGQKDLEVMKSFLGDRYKTMPRTALRYAIEKLPKAERKAYLEGRV